MDGAPAVKFIPVEIEECQIEKGAFDILKEIRPKWNETDIDFKLLTDGITNKLVKCYLKDNSEDVVLIRVYGQKTDMLIDRKAETRNIILLHREKLAPELYATFKNGLAYEFVPGVTLTPESVITPQIYIPIAHKMAKLHLVKPENHQNRKPMLWDKLFQFYDLIPEKFSDPEKQKRFEKMHLICPKSKILDEINELKDDLEQLDSPVVFAHNDLLLGNVIYNSDKRNVTFIDYEYADMNYQAFDIGNHFAEFQGINISENSKTCYPNKEIQRTWLYCYLQEYHNNNRISFTEINKLYIQVNKFSLAAHLLWGIWGLLQAEHSNIEFDYLEYGKLRLGQYFSNKYEFLRISL